MTTKGPSASIMFCPECNNMLYPKEDRMNKTLLFACRNCDHQEEATHHRVYRHDIITKPIDRQHAVAGLSADPALPRTNRRTCPKCGHNEAVFFQSHDRHRDTPMTLNFVCCNPPCNNLWHE